MGRVKEIKKLYEFKKKVQQMSAKEIILAMIDGVQNPVMEVDFHTFGRRHMGVIYGCAATNMICKGAGLDLDFFIPEGVKRTLWSREYAKGGPMEPLFMWYLDLEHAINYLRTGNIDMYNNYSGLLSISSMCSPENELPQLNKFNYRDEEGIGEFLKFAEEQESGLNVLSTNPKLIEESLNFNS